MEIKLNPQEIKKAFAYLINEQNFPLMQFDRDKRAQDCFDDFIMALCAISEINPSLINEVLGLKASNFNPNLKKELKHKFWGGNTSQNNPDNGI